MKLNTLLPFALASAMTVTPAFAHDNDCNVELDGDIQYYKGVLTVDMNNGSVMAINGDHQLSINGERVTLDNEQQQWVEQYYDNIDKAIPMTLEIASEGLAIANVAVSEVFGELLGGDNPLGDDFEQMFTSLNEKLDHSFYDEDGNIQLDSTQFEGDDWFDESWEAEFEENIESLVTQSMGQILIAVGTQMLWNGGDMTEFEERMERFGESMEARIESQAEALEEKADKLCEVLKEANYAEHKMQMTISGLDELNLLDMHGDEMKM